MAPTIVCVLNPDPFALLAVDGCPVLPLVDDVDYQRLAQLTTLFGAELVRTRVEPTRVDRVPTGQAGTVVACGAAVLPAASLYAHLTGRTVRQIEPTGMREALTTCDVIVALDGDLTSKFVIEYGLQASSGHVVGIVAAHDIESLRRQVTKFAAATIASRELTDSVSGGHVAIDAQFPIGIHDLPLQRVVGAQAHVSDIRAALSARADTLTVSATSFHWGVDVWLRPDLVLCPLRAIQPDTLDETLTAAESGMSEQLPGCLRSGTCRVTRAAVEDVVDSPSTIGPSDLQARILVWAACDGLRVDTGPIARRWSLGAQLAMSPAIGAVVSLAGPNMIAAMTCEALLTELRNGASVGPAIATAMAEREARIRGTWLCLFGDPDVRVPLTPVPTAATVTSHATTASTRTPSHDFVGRCIQRVESQVALASLINAEMRACVERSKHLAATRDPSSTTLDTARSISELFALLEQEFITLTQLWLDIELTAAGEWSTDGDVRTLSIAEAPGGPRTLILGLETGDFVVDAPNDQSPRMYATTEGRTVKLRVEGVPSDPNLFSHVLVLSRYREDNQVLPWPRPASDIWERTIDVPVGPLVVVWIAIWGRQAACVRCSI